MNIMVPISSIENAVELCNVGSDEVYVGIYDETWKRKFGDFEEINRMSSFGKKANVTIQECINIIKIIHKKGKKIYITFNSAIYSEQQVEYILNFIEKNHLEIVDGFIVSDLYLISRLIDKSYNIVLSTMAGVYNSSIVQFYYNMGIRRMIIPRDVSLHDIKTIVTKFKDVDFEVFIMRNGCKYSDSNCMSYHGRKYGSMCFCIDNKNDSLVFRRNIEDIAYIKEAYANNQLFTKVFHKKACGLCIIDLLYNIGVASIKVVGRADDNKSVVKDVALIRNIIESCEKKDKRNAIEVSAYKNCWYGLNCYFNI